MRMSESNGPSCCSGCVPNLRRVPSHGSISNDQNADTDINKIKKLLLYRCGNTDCLGQPSGQRPPHHCEDCHANVHHHQQLVDGVEYCHQDNSNHNDIILAARLCVDLRAPSERNEAWAQRWMTAAGFVVVEIIPPCAMKTTRIISTPTPTTAPQDGNTTIFTLDCLSQILAQHARCVLRLNVLDSQALYHYIDQHWISHQDKEKPGNYGNSDDDLDNSGDDNDDNPEKTNFSFSSKSSSLSASSSSGKALVAATAVKATRVGRQRKARYKEALRARGLLGLNQAILHVGQDALRIALQAVTLCGEQVAAPQHNMFHHSHQHHLNQPSQTFCHKHSNIVVFHCVQGKDRTGILTMLCQSILGVDDAIIVADYAQSQINLMTTMNINTATSSSSSSSSSYARPSTLPSTNKSDQLKPKFAPSWDMLNASPPHVMEETLAWIRQQWGSIDGYLDGIGFHAQWRARFRATVQSQPPSSPQTKITALARELPDESNQAGNIFSSNGDSTAPFPCRSKL